MDASTQAALRRINRDFHDRHAADFDRTRRRGWPGWRYVVEAAVRRQAASGAGPLRVLDLGCGNGRFALHLEQEPALRGRRSFTYLGIDLSRALIDHALAAAAGLEHVRFEVDDIETLPPVEAPHDLVVLFGVLHHLPGFDCRRRVLEGAAAAAAPGGFVAATCWQVADDPRFGQRRLDWCEEPAVDPAELEAGDYLLRWGPVGSPARRYCHHIDATELERLAAGLPLAEVARYRADGPGGRQNLYWLARRPW